MDFGTLTCPNNAAFKEHYVTDLCILLRWKEDAQEHRLYLDYICDDATRKNDFYYLRHAWRHLLFETSHLTKFKNICIFSDGASKHFKSRYTIKFFHDISIESNKSIVYNFFASYHGSGLWDAHFAKNNAAVRHFLIYMEGLRSKRISSDFSPLSELKKLAQLLLQSLDNTKVYILTNIDRDPSLKPNIKGIRDIQSHHCFQFDDVNYVNFCIMCGDAWDVNHVPFTTGPQTRSSSSASSTISCDQEENTDDDVDGDVTHRPCLHVVDDDAQLELDVNDDDEDDDNDDDADFQWSTSTSTSTISIP